MTVLDYFAREDRAWWLEKIGECEWAAGRLLYSLLSEGRFREMTGESSTVLLLTEGRDLVSFCTLAERDDIQPTDLAPWIGFVYTYPAWRGKRCAGKLIRSAEERAAEKGYRYAHISTGHTGLYEKYGYTLYTILPDMLGEPSRVYRKELIRYRKLTEEDLDEFIRLRIRQLREEGAAEQTDLTPALRDYYDRHCADGTFVSWLAEAGGRIVGTSGISFVEKPPYFGCPNGRIALLSSMYTDPAYRRRGIAKTLLSRVVEEARRYGCGVVQITASQMGTLLYADFGFERNGNFMQYRL